MRVTIAKANHKQKAYDVEDIKHWEPKQVNFLGDVVLFQISEENEEGETEITQYSMTIDEYNSVFV